jgi:1-deoxy-D-xylulose-5-phosphate synthase
MKGKGYSPAESSPDGYHSVIRDADIRTFHTEFADKLISLAENDEKITAITAAMGIGTGLNVFGEKYPDRYFDVGIAESHALTFSAGLAAGGYKPFVAIYSTFLQRGYDNLLHDIALQNLPVKLMIDRAGLSVGDGATHHGIFDVAFISHIPNMTLLAPASYASLSDMIAYASNHNGPIAIRYPNGAEYEDLLAHFKNISECTGVDVADCIMAHIEKSLEENL